MFNFDRRLYSSYPLDLHHYLIFLKKYRQMICNLPLTFKKNNKKKGQAHDLSVSWAKCTSLTKLTLVFF